MAQPLSGDLVKVGPKGYEHGWIFVGVPGVGQAVHHTHHGKGVVTAHGDGKVSVQFAKSGETHHFEHAGGGGPGKLVEHTPDASFTRTSEADWQAAEKRRQDVFAHDSVARDHTSIGPAEVVPLGGAGKKSRWGKVMSHDPEKDSYRVYEPGHSPHTVSGSQLREHVRANAAERAAREAEAAQEADKGAESGAGHEFFVKALEDNGHGYGAGYAEDAGTRQILGDMRTNGWNVTSYDGHKGAELTSPSGEKVSVKINHYGKASFRDKNDRPLTQNQVNALLTPAPAVDHGPAARAMVEAANRAASPHTGGIGGGYSNRRDYVQALSGMTPEHFMTLDDNTRRDLLHNLEIIGAAGDTHSRRDGLGIKITDAANHVSAARTQRSILLRHQIAAEHAEQDRLANLGKAAGGDGDDLRHVYVSGLDDVLKFSEQDDGSLMVDGIASSPRLDLDQQIADPAWLKSAMPEWMTWGNVREMHGASAVGVGKSLAHGDGDKWALRSHVVDPSAVAKVKAGVYKGYSIGIKGARVVSSPDAPKGRIVGGTIVEVSLVDRPANPDSQLTIAKAFGAGLVAVRPDGAAYQVIGTDVPITPADVTTAPNPLVVASALRAKAANPYGSPQVIGTDVPITPAPEADAIGTTVPKPRAEVKIPIFTTNPVTVAQLSARDYRKTARLIEDIERGDLTRDILKAADADGGDADAAEGIIRQIAQLIISEAQALADGDCSELDDIQELCRAAYALKSFAEGERYEDDSKATPSDVPSDMLTTVNLAAEGETLKRDFSDKQRAKLAKSGAAMPDGSFPIPDADALGRAIHLAGNAKDPDAARAHIKARAAALGLADQIPDTWKASTVDAVPVVTETDSRITEIVKAAVAEASAPHMAEIATLRAELVKVQSRPIPGGPMITNAAYHAPEQLTNKSAGPDKSAPAYWEQMADRTIDPAVKHAYLARAAQLKAR